MTLATSISIDISASSERVFRALTTNNELQAWFAEHADVDPAAGRFDFWGRHTPGNPGPGAGRHDLRGYTPPREFAFAWTLRGVPSTFSVRLDEADAVTRVTVEPESEEFVMSDFWCLSLQNLRSWVEDGVVAWRPDFSLVHQGEVRLEITTAASPEAVFEALLEPEQLSRWMMANDATVEPVAGGRYDLGWPDGWGRPLAILELEPAKRLKYSWSDPDVEGTVVTWELEGADGATRITLVHSGFGSATSGDEYYGGWADFLVRLKWMVEKGAGWVGPAWVAPHTRDAESGTFVLAETGATAGTPGATAVS
jgi:uncharacterized protein YndB with AHSA1/START domain